MVTLGKRLSFTLWALILCHMISRGKSKTLYLLFCKIYLLPQKLEEWRLIKSEFSLIKSNDPSLRWSCKVIYVQRQSSRGVL